jgi:hypothetical protein
MKRLFATTLLLVFSIAGCSEVADGLIRVKAVNDLEVITQLVEQLNYQKVPLEIALGNESPFLNTGEGKVRIAFELVTNKCEQIIMTHNKSTQELDILFGERMSGLFSKTSAEHYQELIKIIENSFGKGRVNAEDISGKVGSNLTSPPSSCSNR